MCVCSCDVYVIFESNVRTCHCFRLALFFLLYIDLYSTHSHTHVHLSIRAQNYATHLFAESAQHNSTIRGGVSLGPRRDLVAQPETIIYQTLEQICPVIRLSPVVIQINPLSAPASVCVCWLRLRVCVCSTIVLSI